jgi:hypothetical protein
VVTGPGGLFDTPDGRPQGDVADGLSRTVLVVEARDPVPWTKPEDVSFSADRLPALGGPSADGFVAAVADGSARFFRREATPPNVLRALLTRAGGEVIPLP